jgi:hypothetical protein
MPHTLYHLCDDSLSGQLEVEHFRNIMRPLKTIRQLFLWVVDWVDRLVTSEL